MPSLLFVMAGGALGSGARYLTGRATLALFGPALPWGTLAVNLIGGLAMGLLTGVLARTTGAGGATESWRLFVGVGVLGGFTTFSAFSLDVVMLAERGQAGAAIGYALVSVSGSVAALMAGLAMARSYA